MTGARDQGGLDTAMARYGGRPEDWVDLSTGINPVPYPVPPLDPQVWAALPGRAAHDALTEAAREFWGVPDDAAILAAPGTASLIAHFPGLLPARRVHIPTPVRTRHTELTVPAPPTQVVDTIGAGDSVVGGVLRHLDRIGALSSVAVAELDADQWRATAEFAGEVAAVTVSRPGADPPWASELASD